MPGILYIVPTPIGNLNDISLRALEILRNVNFIIAEDTRHTNFLLKHFKILTEILLLNNWNERSKTKQLILKLQNGFHMALVSDSGTPLINDPGYCLVQACYNNNIKIIPLPGPCAAITALSASGLSSNRFCYEGFFPKKSNKRKILLNELRHEQRTLIFYESSRRLLKTLEDIVLIFGSSRLICLARELTKIWESINKLSSIELLKWIKLNKNRYRGEIVLIIEGYKKKNACGDFLSAQMKKTFFLLMESLSLKQTISIVSKIYNLRKNILYKYAINNRNIIK